MKWVVFFVVCKKGKMRKTSELLQGNNASLVFLFLSFSPHAHAHTRRRVNITQYILCCWFFGDVWRAPYPLQAHTLTLPNQDHAPSFVPHQFCPPPTPKSCCASLGPAERARTLCSPFPPRPVSPTNVLSNSISKRLVAVLLLPPSSRRGTNKGEYCVLCSGNPKNAPPHRVVIPRMHA